METFSTKRSLRRRLHSAWKHFVIFAEVCVSASVLVFLFNRIIWMNAVHFSQKEEVVVTAGPVALLVLAYGITAGLVFNAVWEKYRNVMMSVMRGDRTTFLENRDERIPVVLYLLLWVFSLMLLTVVGMLHFESHTSWLICEGVVSLITCFFWILTVKIDNPCTSSWLQERVISEWLSVDIDKVFFKKSKD